MSRPRPLKIKGINKGQHRAIGPKAGSTFAHSSRTKLSVKTAKRIMRKNEPISPTLVAKLSEYGWKE